MFIQVKLQNIIETFQKAGIRTSVFVDTQIENILHSSDTGTNRIELYTEPYVTNFKDNQEKAVKPFINAAKLAFELGLHANALRDLNLENLQYLIHNIPEISEVSIGHALISDAIYYGLENTIQMYQHAIKLGIS